MKIKDIVDDIVTGLSRRLTHRTPTFSDSPRLLRRLQIFEMYHKVKKCIADKLTRGHGTARIVTISARRPIHLRDIYKILLFQVNIATCFPPTVIEMINSRDANKYDLASLKTIICAGAPIAPAAVEQMIKKYHVKFIVGNTIFIFASFFTTVTKS